MSDENKNNNPRPNKAKIDQWKKEHGEVFQLSVEDKILLLRKPKMRDLERAHAADPKKQKPFNFHRSIIENCKLYADDDLLENDDNYFALCTKLDEIIEVKEAEIKKL